MDDATLLQQFRDIRREAKDHADSDERRFAGIENKVEEMADTMNKGLGILLVLRVIGGAALTLLSGDFALHIWEALHK